MALVTGTRIGSDEIVTLVRAGASLAPRDGGAPLPVQGMQPGDQIRYVDADSL
jgi:hypothetical protein